MMTDFENQEEAATYVALSKVGGGEFGLFATKTICKDQFIGCYPGRVILEDEYDQIPGDNKVQFFRIASGLSH
jgi:hypothetical protein